MSLLSKTAIGPRRPECCRLVRADPGMIGVARHWLGFRAGIMLAGLVACAGDAPPIPRDQQDGPVQPEPDLKPAVATTNACRRPSVTDLPNDPVVQWGMREALRRGAGTRPLTEQGGWIYQCRTQPAGGSGAPGYHLDLELVEGGYRTTESMEMLDEKYRAHMPEHPECRTVGIFHLHPSADASHAKASDSDLTGHARRGIPSYFFQPRRPPPVRGPIGRIDPTDYGDWTKPGTDNLSWTCECDSPTAPKSDKDAEGRCALRGERIFGRVTAEIGTPEPASVPMGPLEWPRDRSPELAAAIQRDADLVAHVIGQSLGFGATAQSIDQLIRVMEGALQGPMNLARPPARTLRGPYLGQQEHEVFDRSAVADGWDGSLVTQGVTFAHQALGKGNRLEGRIQADARARVYERSDRIRAFAVRYDGQTEGSLTAVEGGPREGHLGSNGDGEGLFIWGQLVEARRDLVLRMTLRADGRGDVQATATVVPTLVLQGGALAAFPAAAPGSPGAQTLLATSATQGGRVAAELERAMAQLSPEQRRMMDQALGGDPGQTPGSVMRQFGGGRGGVSDGLLRLPGPPAGRDRVLYYLMTVIQFNLESRSLPERKWSGNGAASVAARLEVGPDQDTAVPRLPGLLEIDRALNASPSIGPVAMRAGEGAGARRDRGPNRDAGNAAPRTPSLGRSGAGRPAWSSDEATRVQ